MLEPRCTDLGEALAYDQAVGRRIKFAASTPMYSATASSRVAAGIRVRLADILVEGWRRMRSRSGVFIGAYA